MGRVGHEDDATAYSHEWDLILESPLSPGEMQDKIDAFLLELTRSLRGNGCKLIGHIKGLLEVEGNGYLFFSITSFDGKARYKRELAGEIPGGKLTINAVVYGAEQRSVEKAVQDGFKRHFAE